MASAAKLVRGRVAELAPLAVALACLGIVSEARADPCEAIPDHGALPSYLEPGERFSGPVVYVGDGDSLCVGVGSGGPSWVEVRLADFYAPELSSPEGPAAKRALEGLVMGREVACVAEHQSYDRVVARCELNGHSIGDLLRSGGGSEGGKGFSESDTAFDAGNAIQPIGPGSLGEQQGDWMLAAAALSATAALGFLYVGLKKPISRKSARRGEQDRRRR